MLKNILNLKGVKQLKKNQKLIIKGGRRTCVVQRPNGVYACVYFGNQCIEPICRAGL